ncbi:31441_t:CDS:2 [Racocetra persica]|uniref:31441_t:CDS:1 n=1 Tax=Racocetra persica TaxID=160502 RepID=A0ACA9M9W2_9GLOM|nr:31441_t:CDS:2 [Racocetra persica]
MTEQELKQQITQLKRQVYILSSKFRQCEKHDEDKEYTQRYLENKIHEGTSIPERQLSQKEAKEETTPRNLYQKLQLIQSQIGQLEKTRENKFQKYFYAETPLVRERLEKE